MKVAIYDTVSGKIKRFVYDSWDCIDIQCTQENEDFYLNCPDGMTHIIDNEPTTVTSVPTPEQIITSITDAVQKHLDSVAQVREYDGIVSLCSYVDTGDDTFDAEGAAGRTWRSSVWRYCKQLRIDIQAGTRTVPTIEELINELPEMEWPS